MSKTKQKPRFLTREQIDEVIAGLSAGDVIEAMGDDEVKVRGTKMIGLAFDSAAERMGVSNGVRGTHMISAADFEYLAKKLGGAINVDAPLSEGQPS